MTAALVPVSQKQLANLALLDQWLAHGPYYVRNTALGALAGAAVAYFRGRKGAGGGGDRALKYAVVGAGVTLAGGFAFFQLAKWASGKEHQVLQAAVPAPAAPVLPVVTTGDFAGSPRALYPTVDAHQVYR